MKNAALLTAFGGRIYDHPPQQARFVRADRGDCA